MSDVVDGLLVCVVGGLAVWFITSKLGSSNQMDNGDNNGSGSQYWWQPGYNPFNVTPARDAFPVGIIGDLQFWTNEVLNDTGLRW